MRIFDREDLTLTPLAALTVLAIFAVLFGTGWLLR